MTYGSDLELEIKSQTAESLGSIKALLLVDFSMFFLNLIFYAYASVFLSRKLG